MLLGTLRSICQKGSKNDILIFLTEEILSLAFSQFIPHKEYSLSGMNCQEQGQTLSVNLWNIFLIWMRHCSVRSKYRLSRRKKFFPFLQIFLFLSKSSTTVHDLAIESNQQPLTRMRSLTSLTRVQVRCHC